MPKSSKKYQKFKRCVKKVSAKDTTVNPYAVCKASTGYGLKKKMITDKNTGITHKKYIDFCEMCGKKMRKTKVKVYMANICRECIKKQYR